MTASPADKQNSCVFVEITIPKPRSFIQLNRYYVTKFAQLLPRSPNKSLRIKIYCICSLSVLYSILFPTFRKEFLVCLHSAAYKLQHISDYNFTRRLHSCPVLSKQLQLLPVSRQPKVTSWASGGQPAPFQQFW